MPSLFAYPVTPETASILYLKFNVLPKLGSFVVEIPNWENFILTMSEETLRQNFVFDEKDLTKQMFPLTPRSVEDYLSHKKHGL